MLQVMKYMLLNFDFLGSDVQHFKEFFDEQFSLPRASLVDYLNFIQFNIIINKANKPNKIEKKIDFL